MSHNTIVEIISHSVFDTLPMIPILFILYFLLEYFSHEKQMDLIARLKISGKMGPLAGTLLGIIPECGMSVFMTSLFLSKRISIGTLIATYIATSDEALPVLLAYGNQYENILHLIFAKFIGGIAFGYLIDFLVTNKIYDGQERVIFSSKVVEIKNELEQTKYWQVIKHSLERTLRIYLWVLSITLLIGLILFLFDLKEFILKTAIHPIIQIIITGIVGLIPNCGASIAISEAYLLTGLSFSATVAGLSAGAGYGPIVLIKDGNWKTSVKLLGICLVSSITLGILIYYLLRV